MNPATQNQLTGGDDATGNLPGLVFLMVSRFIIFPVIRTTVDSGSQAFFSQIYSLCVLGLWLFDVYNPPFIRAAIQAFILLPANGIVGYFLGKPWSVSELFVYSQCYPRIPKPLDGLFRPMYDWLHLVPPSLEASRADRGNSNLLNRNSRVSIPHGDMSLDINQPRSRILTLVDILAALILWRQEKVALQRLVRMTSVKKYAPR